jgi:hypothetical protein
VGKGKGGSAVDKNRTMLLRKEAESLFNSYRNEEGVVGAV